MKRLRIPAAHSSAAASNLVARLVSCLVSALLVVSLVPVSVIAEPAVADDAQATATEITATDADASSTTEGVDATQDTDATTATDEEAPVTDEAAVEPLADVTPEAATEADGIILPGNYASRGVTIDNIAFHVLYVDQDNNRALLLTKDVQKDALFDEKGSNSWENSSARKWLNDEWLRDKNDLSANVVKTTITTRNNYSDPNPKFVSTEDKVFLLSEPDVYGEESRFAGRLQAEDYTVVDKDGKGVRLIAKDGPRVASKDGQLRQWWMRSPVYTNSEVSYVCKIGRDLISDANFADSERGFRPALWVKLAEISTDTNPGSIELTPSSVVVGPGDVVRFDHVVKDADGKPLAQDQQEVTWEVTGGNSWYNGGPISAQNTINSEGRLELDGWTVDGTVLTVTATSKVDPAIQAEAQVAVNVSDWPVKTISKPGPDCDNMVILFLADGFQHDEQDKFLEACNNMWQAMASTEPYRSFANRINVYAMCTDSIQSGLTGEQSFFRTAVGTTARNADLSSWTNHVPGRVLGPAFAEKYMDKGAKASDINSYVIVGNSPIYGGASHVSRGDANFHYVCMTTGSGYTNTFCHEMGHNLLGLGDEYNENGGALEKDNSPNMSRLGDPKEVNWREMLGYDNTGIYPMGKLFLSSSRCMMNDMSRNFCSVCELQGARTMATDIDDQSFYVFKPQLTFGDEYADPDKFSSGNYYSFTTYRASHKIDNDNFGSLTSSDASTINNLKGQTMSFRTIIQNLSPTEDRRIKVSFEIKHKDGTSTNVKGTQEFKIGKWDDKEARHAGRMTYLGGDYDYKQGFNSGLLNCDLKVDVPTDANVQVGDKVVFSIKQVKSDGSTVLLLDEGQSAAAYTNVKIRYQDAAGNQLPDTAVASIPVRVGSTYTPTPPAVVGKYTYVGTAEEKEPVVVGAEGAELHYTYTLSDTPAPEPDPDPEPQPEPKKKIAVPTAATNLTYDGGTKTGVAAGEGYTVSGTASARAAGDYIARVTPADGYCWEDGSTSTREIPWKIERASLANAQVTVSPRSFQETGSDIMPQPTVQLGSRTLTPNQDYSVSYTDNRSPGTAHVTVSGQGNYQGEASTTFTITAKPPEKINISRASITIDPVTYNGQPQEPTCRLTYNGKPLQKGTDYEVVFSNNTNAGSQARATFRGKGAYTGEVTRTFTINRMPVPVPQAVQGLVADGNPKTGVRSGTGYTLSGDTATEAGNYTATATLDANYSWQGLTGAAATAPCQIAWTISAPPTPDPDPGPEPEPELTRIDVPLARTGLVYTGEAQRGVYEGTGYTLSGDVTGVNAGATYRAYATPREGYCWRDGKTDTRQITWTISRRSLAGAQVTVADQAYTGGALTPTPTVVVAGRTLVLGTDFSVQYTNHYGSSVRDATARVTVRGQGNYTGTLTSSFTIKAPAPQPQPQPQPTPTPVQSRDMYRLYNPNSGEHFYTASVAERDNVVRAGWRYEGVGWKAPTTGDPVYRLYNPNAGDHHYTTSSAERDNLVRVGWRYEGIGWYSGGSTPLYRQYNPNARAGSHNFTTSQAENNHLVSVGWRAEGIGWYGLS